MPHIALIAAIDKHNAIGKDNELLYRLPNDLKRFKTLTTGNTIIMGRRTFESLPQGALPYRRNIVLSRRCDVDFRGAERYASLQEALTHCRTDEKAFVIGGASVYRAALPLADELLLTFVHDEAPEADAYFPSVEWEEWEKISEEMHPADDRHAHPYSFVDYIRREKAEKK